MYGKKEIELLLNDDNFKKTIEQILQPKQKNYFEELYNIDVGDKIEKKVNLSYLSWAYAWAEVKKKHPTANYKIYETPEGVIYFHDNKTAWVKTSVTIDEVEHIDYLPVMNNKNRSILLNDITSFEINKTIQRSLTKAIARHGLGLYIYAGEDLPEAVEEGNLEKINDIKQQLDSIEDLETLKEFYHAQKDQKPPKEFMQLVSNKKSEIQKQSELNFKNYKELLEIKEIENAEDLLRKFKTEKLSEQSKIINALKEA